MMILDSGLLFGPLCIVQVDLLYSRSMAGTCLSAVILNSDCFSVTESIKLCFSRLTTPSCVNLPFGQLCFSINSTPKPSFYGNSWAHFFDFRFRLFFQVFKYDFYHIGLHLFYPQCSFKHDN